MLMSRMNESRGGALIALDDEILKDEFLIAEKWRRKALLIAIENLKYKDENITEKTIVSSTRWNCSCCIMSLTTSSVNSWLW